MKLNIPKEVTIAGITIKTVIITKKGEWDEERTIGKADYENQKIIIDTTFVSCPEMLEQVYFHELLHWIYFILGETEMQRNEKLIDLVAHLLYQSIGKQVTFN